MSIADRSRFGGRRLYEVTIKCPRVAPNGTIDDSLWDEIKEWLDENYPVRNTHDVGVSRGHSDYMLYVTSFQLALALDLRFA